MISTCSPCVTRIEPVSVFPFLIVTANFRGSLVCADAIGTKALGEVAIWTQSTPASTVRKAGAVGRGVDMAVPWVSNGGKPDVRMNNGTKMARAQCLVRIRLVGGK